MNFTRISYLVILLFISLLIFSCNEESNITESNTTANESILASETIGTTSNTNNNGLINGNMESGDSGYWKGGTKFQGYTFNYSNAEYVSPTHSLNIVASNSPKDNFTYWAQTFNASDYVGKKITLKVSTKYSGVDGKGVIFVLRGDDTDIPQGYAEAFSSTQGKIELTGSSDWKNLQVSLNPVPNGIKSLTVYMLVASSNGSVFFDDLNLSISNASPTPYDLQNVDFETGDYAPDSWWFSGPNNISIKWDSSEFLSSTHSCKMSSISSNNNFAVIGQTFTAAKLIGKKLIFNVYAKANDLTGEGFFIAIRGDDAQPPTGAAEVFVTTQSKILYTGSFGWKKISVTLDKVPDNIKALTFYLIYGRNTSGTVYFDDASLEQL